MDLLTDTERQAFLFGHEGWTIEGEVLSKTFVHDSFAAAVGFVAAVGVLCLLYTSDAADDYFWV